MNSNNRRQYQRPGSASSINPSPGRELASRRITKDEVRRIYVKSNYKRFEKDFASCDAHGWSSFSFSFCAWLFGPFWFFYRKMYAEGFIIFGIHFFTTIILSAMGAPDSADRIAGSVTNFIIATFAKNIYWAAINRKIAKARLLYPRGTHGALRWLDDHGGVNYWAIPAGVVFTIIIIAILSI